MRCFVTLRIDFTIFLENLFLQLFSFFPKEYLFSQELKFQQILISKKKKNIYKTIDKY